MTEERARLKACTRLMTCALSLSPPQQLLRSVFTSFFIAVVLPRGHGAGVVVDEFVLIEVPDEVLVDRVSGRRIDPSCHLPLRCGLSYHLAATPPTAPPDTPPPHSFIHFFLCSEW